MQRFAQDPNDRVFQDQPWRFYERARASGDFIFWEDYGMPVAVTAAAVDAVLKHRSFGRAHPGGEGPPMPDHMPTFARLERHSLLELEAPDHTRIRGLVLRAFTSRRIAALAPRISRIADDLLQDCLADGDWDLIEHFARPLPILVITDLLGVPQERARDLLAWSNAMVGVYQSRRNAQVEAEAEAASKAFVDWIRDVIATKRKAPEDDLLSGLIAAESEDGKLSEDELIATVILLLNAGHEATVNALGNTARLLLEYEARVDALTPDAIDGTVEEGLRVRPPLHMFTRHVYERVEIAGETFEPGQEIAACLGSACHDDAVWQKPDHFDPFRPIRRNAAFGAGIHFCVGAPLARLEMKVALPLLFSRCPMLRITEPPVVAPLYHFDGLERLMVTCQGEALSST